MAKRRLLVLVFLFGCNNGGVLGGGGADGDAGADGMASCTGAPPFYCVSTCSSDVAMPATCSGGLWSCAIGVPIDTCKCQGNPPPEYVCGSDGWVRVDGGSGGAAGRGGAGGQGGLGGQGNESCSTAGMSCGLAGFWCCGGMTCQANVCVPSPGADGGADAGTLTYVADIQPILRSTCGSCHATDSPAGTGAAVPFVDSYAVTQRASMSPDFYGCPGESVGACINRAAQIQAVEGSRCRTFDRPFHRDGFDRCITDAERALISAWVAGGMIER